MKTSREVFEFILSLEKKYSLFDKQINGVFFWKIIRFDLTQQLLCSLGYMSPKHRRSKIQSLKMIFKIIYNSRYSILRTKKQGNAIVHENPRKIHGEHGFYDPYTAHFVDRLISDNVNFEIIDEGLRGIHYEPSSEKRSFGDSFFYDLVYRAFIRKKPFKISAADDELFTKIESDILATFNLNISIFNLFRNKLTAFKTQYAKFNKIFSIKQPKRFYLVCSYGKEGIIAAAKKHNVEVIEFQHGNMSFYHMGYSFPDIDKVPYFPDKFYMFGKYWFDSTPLPLDEGHVEYIGYQDLLKKSKLISLERGREKNILFISQHTIAHRLIDKAIETARNNPEYNVYYRLHPAERAMWKTEYPKLEACNLPNFIVKDEEENIFYDFARCMIVVGVYSTSMYESLFFACAPILFDLSGIEYMDFMLKNGYALKLDIDEPLDLLLIDRIKKVESNYLFGSL